LEKKDAELLCKLNQQISARRLAEDQKAQFVGMCKIQRFEDFLMESRTIEAQLFRQHNVLSQMIRTRGCPQAILDFENFAKPEKYEITC